ncbi:MAG: DNA polymerase IV [Desulfovermiculus sp.]|nr:DNA polymerase IV [Desulfovermiculus sp.]
MDAAPRIILHLDMDAFFASVEQVDHPELQGKPVVVGGLSDRGVVSTASYEARRFGIHSAMPMATARHLCPWAVFLSGNRRRYSQISRDIMHIMHDYSPVVEKASIDEAYMDLTGSERLLGPPREVAREIKGRILSDHGLTASMGLAPNKFLAKIASDLDKPDGLRIIPLETVAEFMAALPVAKLPGVGSKSLERLKELGVTLCGHISRYSLEFWEAKWGKRGRALYHLAQGMDDSPVVPRRRAKSCGAEDTFPQDTADRRVIKTWLLHQSEEVGRALRRINSQGRTVTLKIKFSDFQSVTRNATLNRPTDCTQTIFRTACTLLDGLSLSRSVRLCGVSVSQFERRQAQLSLFLEHNNESDRNLDRAADLITSKYGPQALVRGAVLDLKKKELLRKKENR